MNYINFREMNCAEEMLLWPLRKCVRVYSFNEMTYDAFFTRHPISEKIVWHTVYTDSSLTLKGLNDFSKILQRYFKVRSGNNLCQDSAKEPSKEFLTNNLG